LFCLNKEEVRDEIENGGAGHVCMEKDTMDNADNDWIKGSLKISVRCK
jgi:hypothetical protein